MNIIKDPVWILFWGIPVIGITQNCMIVYFMRQSALCNSSREFSTFADGGRVQEAGEDNSETNRRNRGN